MTDKITKLEDIQNPEAFLKSYYDALDDLKSLRAELKGLEKERDSLKADLDGMSDEALNKFKEKAIKAEIKAQLEGDGIKNPERILKYMDLAGIEYDEEENLVGVDDKLAGIKEDFPELFDAKRRAARTDVDIHADKPANTTKSTTESQVDALFSSR